MIRCDVDGTPMTWKGSPYTTDAFGRMYAFHNSLFECESCGKEMIAYTYDNQQNVIEWRKWKENPSMKHWWDKSKSERGLE